MILAVAVLHQTIGIRGVITIGGRGVQATLLDRDFVDLTRGIPEIGFEIRPVRVMKTAQQDGEPIIRTFNGTERLIESEQRLKKMSAFGGPVLDMGFAMTGLGKNECQPYTHEPAVRYPLMKMVASQMLLQDGGELHFFHEANQQRNVIDTFML